MKIAILGYGIQGRSTFNYLKGGGHDITIVDKESIADLPEGVKGKFGKDYLSDLDQYDLLFRTSSLHPRDIVNANTESILDKVTTNTNRFFEDCKSKNIIGVTGTKGKGTTSTLIYEILKALGKNAHLGGNVGTSPLDLMAEGIDADNWVVLELASYQLIDLKYSPHLAVCLIVEPEHLDWHKDEAEYYNAKAQLFKHQTPEDIALYYADNDKSREIASSGKAKLIPYFAEPGAIVRGDAILIDGQEIIKTNDLQLPGKHNYQNVCAAITAVWQIDRDVQKISGAIRNFKSLPFRIELRRVVEGVKYYNDSFSSAPTSAVAAIEAIPEKKILILGGMDRKLDLSHLSQSVKDNEDSIGKIVLIGESAGRTAENLDKAGFSNYEVSELKDMDSIVKRAKELANDGDAVVLSPGFPSFDMFKNFEDRGIQFNQAVENL